MQKYGLNLFLRRYSVSGDAILDFMNNNQASPEIKNKLQEALAGMDKKKMIEMNPVLQMPYIK
jgi:hypothetical protein